MKEKIKLRLGNQADLIVQQDKKMPKNEMKTTQGLGQERWVMQMF